MNIINTRSPFHIEINEIGQIGGKLELFVYHKGDSIPVVPTYTLTKLIPSNLQPLLVWNISGFLKDEIDIINPVNVNAAEIENNYNWVFCRVDRYKLVGGAYTNLSSITYVAVNGYGKYTDGYQVAESSLIKVLKNKLIVNNYKVTPGYVNVIIDKVADKNLFAIYERNDGASYSEVQNLLTGQSGIFNLKIPLSIVVFNGSFVNGCKLTISYETAGSPIVNIFQTFPQEECRYVPVICNFINRFGGWEYLTFYKAQLNAFAVKATDYNLMPENYNYNTFQGQRKSMNINGSSSVKLNTGFVEEQTNELMQDLLLSEVVLLDNKPVTVKTQSLTFKTHLKDRNINYEIEFDFAFDLINNAL